MSDRRVYPSKLAQRDRVILANARTALHACNRSDLRVVLDALAAIDHRPACAARYDETREKKLSARERANISETLMLAIRAAIIVHGDADRARDGARALVRLLR